MRITDLAFVSLLCLSWGNGSHARILENWPYEKLSKHSDLVVIAETIRVEPTKDTLSTPKWNEIGWGGLNTVFKIKSAIKGTPQQDQITLLHFRIEKSNLELINGPLLATFKKKREYILFLKKRSDGRYELVTGQIDPVLAIRELSMPFHMASDEE